MRLKIALPTRIVYDGEVSKLSAEAINGSFTLLPHHIDFVTALVPGILYFDTAGEKNEEIFFAVDEGIMVKRGADVFVSSRNAVCSDDLETLHSTIHDHFEVLNERERKARSALVHLEADFIRRYLKMGREVYG
ncbi:MAG: F0F1 ATP synthase subunit epsilon [Anaerolineales bacterium]|jgi:F-type H+-transporting ATPase subunit epsilon